MLVFSSSHSGLYHWSLRLFFLFVQTGLSSSKLSMSKALPLTKVVQNDAYTAPVLPSSVRTKALTSMSRTLVNKEEPPKELPPAEVRGKLQLRVGLCWVSVYPRGSSEHSMTWMLPPLSAMNKPASLLIFGELAGQ